MTSKLVLVRREDVPVDAAPRVGMVLGVRNVVRQFFKRPRQPDVGSSPGAPRVFNDGGDYFIVSPHGRRRRP